MPIIVAVTSNTAEAQGELVGGLEVRKHRKVFDVLCQELPSDLLGGRGYYKVHDVDPAMGAAISRGHPTRGISELIRDLEPSQTGEELVDGCFFAWKRPGEDLGANDRHAPDFIAPFSGLDQPSDRSLVVSEVIDQDRRIND